MWPLSSGECYVSIDIEADGPAPGLNSMLSLGAAAFTSDGALAQTFSAKPRAAPRGARGREDHALVGIAAGGLGGVPRAHAGTEGRNPELPRMGGASGKDAGPPRHGRLPRRLRRDVGPVVSAPIRRRRSLSAPCDRYQDAGHGRDGGGLPRDREIEPAQATGARARSTRTSRSTMPSSRESCS